MTDLVGKVLVVDDSPDNSFLVKKILTHHGFEVDIVDDGQIALDYCEDHTPDLIFMDVSLPSVDGLEVTRQLRQNDAFRDIPIIALTAHVMAGFAEKTIEAGCTDYMSKPFKPEHLVAMVSRFFPAEDTSSTSAAEAPLA